MKKILYVTSECTPFSGNGSSLAEVSMSLPSAVAALGYDVRVISPLYGSVSVRNLSKMEYIGKLNVNLSWRKQECEIFTAKNNGVTHYFIANDYYFGRENLFGYMDDTERFAFFSKAVVDSVKMLDFQPDIIHANDWQSALVPVYMKTLYSTQPFCNNDGLDGRPFVSCGDVKMLFTIQHINRQGKCDAELIEELLGISHNHLCVLETSGKVNFTKGAIVVSDKFSTVSPNYAKELTGSGAALGLENIIMLNDYKFSGILHGIDYEKYNPTTDRMIYCTFDGDNLENKLMNKLSMQKMLCLRQGKNIPLIAMITKLVSKKGIDLVKNIISTILEKDVQFVLLGQGEAAYESFFSDLERQHPSKMRTILMRDDEMAHKIFAASDYFLMPSQTEPCGRSQMIASRYGSLPIVRKIGGLADSVIDVSEGGTGFVFSDATGEAFTEAIERALFEFTDENAHIRHVKRAMNTDFSWENAAKQYAALYDEMLR